MNWYFLPKSLYESQLKWKVEDRALDYWVLGQNGIIIIQESTGEYKSWVTL